MIHETNPDLGTIYKPADQYSLEVPRWLKTRKVCATIARLKDTVEAAQLNVVWDPGLESETEKDIRGNTGEIQIKSGVT